MRTKVTLTLLLLNVALFFWIFWYEAQPDNKQTTIAHAVLPADATAVIDRIEIRRAGAAPISLEQRTEGWFLAAPIDWPANRNAVDQIIDELRMLQNKTRFEVAKLEKTGQRLADYGLVNPPLTLAFGHGGKTWELQAGTYTPDSSNLYLLPPPGTFIHVVDRGFADVLPATADALRSDTLIDVHVWEARSLVVQSSRSAERVRVAANGDRWLLESPIEARANKQAVELAVQQLGALRAASFVDPRTVDARTTGLENPAFRISVEGNQRRQVLLLGAPAATQAAAPLTATAGATTYYGKLDNRAAVFTVAVDRILLTTLGAAQEQLRDRHVLALKPAQLKSLELKTPGQPDVVLQRLETGAWQTLSRAANDLSPAQAADSAIVERLIDRLTQLEAKGFRDVPEAVDIENWGLKLPIRTVTFTLADGTTSTLSLGGTTVQDGRTLRWARASGSDTVYLVGDEIFGELPATALAFRQRVLRELPSGARITGLTLQRRAGGAPIYAGQLSAPEEKWETKLAGESARTREAVTHLLATVRQLRAKEFVRDHFDAAVAPDGKPWVYALSVTIELNAANDTTAARTEPIELLFSERLGGTVMYAGSAALDCAFTVPQDVLDAVFALAFGDRDPGEPAAVGDNAPLSERNANPTTPTTTPVTAK